MASGLGRLGVGADNSFRRIGIDCSRATLPARFSKMSSRRRAATDLLSTEHFAGSRKVGETQRDRLHENAPKRTKAKQRMKREIPSKTERTETYGNADTALWTTVSGFESLPPSQVSKFFSRFDLDRLSRSNFLIGDPRELRLFLKET